MRCRIPARPTSEASVRGIAFSQGYGVREECQRFEAYDPATAWTVASGATWGELLAELMRVPRDTGGAARAGHEGNEGER